ncbi:Tetracycline resistance protein, class B [Streptomyces sp. MBT84]|uniref:MFS transporter n=1 Tax=unclassified Streptomyces TaxID=2593676 RepID=UPI001C6ED94F|nr:MFS transporter [Streptomyces sp. MBT84]MBW8705327.1 Tetracycline resistance protein, class B [Streptomyces sp. MBT84]
MPRPTVPPVVAFVSSAIAFMTVMAAAGAPSALLIVYQQHWHFSDSELTLAFAIYALALLLALLGIGSLSDRIGRRPVLITALALQAIAMMVFLFAPNIGVIIVARALQGFATGAATSAFSAYIAEVAPAARKKVAALFVSIASVAGLGIGVVLTGVAIQFAAAPAAVVFGAALAITVIAIVVTATSPETVGERPGIGDTLVPRIGVPSAARTAFARTTPGMIGIWMSAGLVLGLGASIVHQALHITSGAALGLVVAAQPLAAAVSALVLGALIPLRRFMLAGYVAVLAGVSLEAYSFVAGLASLIVCGAIITGLGFGAVFSSTLSILVPLTRAQERAQLFSAVYVVAYLAYGIPTVVAGFLSDAIGLVPAAIVYASATLAVTAAGLIVSLTPTRSTSRDALSGCTQEARAHDVQASTSGAG